MDSSENHQPKKLPITLERNPGFFLDTSVFRDILDLKQRLGAVLNLPEQPIGDVLG